MAFSSFISCSSLALPFVFARARARRRPFLCVLLASSRFAESNQRLLWACSAARRWAFGCLFHMTLLPVTFACVLIC